MLKTLARMLNQKQWRYEKAWLKAKRKREREEQKLREYLRPHEVLHVGTVVVHCHYTRGLSGSIERYFEFGKNYVNARRSFSFTNVVSRHDLDDLIKAAYEAKQWQETRKRN